MSFLQFPRLVLVAFALFGLFPVGELSAGASACGTMPLLQGEGSGAGAGNPHLTIVSLNMARETTVGRIIKDLSGSKALGTADVWLLQEMLQGHHPNTDAVRELAKAMGLHFVYAASGAEKDGTLSGLAILSRYPLSDVEQFGLPEFDLHFRSRCRIGLTATIAGPWGPVRVFNVHLDTRINGNNRVEQLGPVLKSASSLSSSPVVVGGDFNSSNFHWFWHLIPVPFIDDQVSPLREVFSRSGFDSPLDKLGATFKILWLPLSLDWIFPRGLRTVWSGIEPVDFSDHRAVWVSLIPWSV